MNVTNNYINDDAEIFSKDPSSDVAMLINRNENAVAPRKGIHGRVSANFTTQSLNTSRDKVLVFPSKKDSGLILVKHMVLSTLLPMTLVKRYDKKTHSQKTPVFFDTKTEKFVVLMDSRYLRDISFNQIEPYLQDSLPTGGFKHYPLSSGGGALGLAVDRIQDLQSKTNNPECIRLLIEAYTQFNLSLEEGRRMILLRYKAESSDSSSFAQQFPKRPGPSSKTVKTHIEITQAMLFGDVYYECCDDGVIQKERSFRISKHREQQSALQTYSGIDLGEGRLLLLDYRHEDWVFLKSVVQKLSDLHTDLAAFFDKGVNKGGEVDSLAGPDKLSLLGLIGP